MPEISHSALNIDSLTVRFGGLTALLDVSIEVPNGVRYGILGPNGAGKTTLYHAVTGFVTPVKGRVLLNGEDISKLPPHARVKRGLARTFQITNLFLELSVLENVMMAARVKANTHRVFWRPASHDRKAGEIAHAQLANLGLTHLAGKTVGELGYGQQRLLEIAVALGSQPSVLMLDEPTAGLTAGEIRAVVDLINNLPRSLTVILIEHDLDVIFDVTEYLSVLYFGRAIAHGPSVEIRQDQRVKEIYLGESSKHTPLY